MYMAPEIIEQIPHSYPCDMWSLGIILYMLLSSDYPFDLKNLDYSIVNDPLLFLKKDRWDNVSQVAKAFIQNLLSKDPGERMTAKKALEHVWFKYMLEDDHVVEEELNTPQLRDQINILQIEKQASEEVIDKLAKYKN